MSELSFVIKGADSSYRKRNMWFANCRRRGIPFVYAQIARKYGEVHWDCITLRGDEDIDVLRANEGLAAIAYTYMVLRKTRFFGGEFTGELGPLPAEVCEAAAQDVASCLNAARIQRQLLPQPHVDSAAIERIWSSAKVAARAIRKGMSRLINDEGTP